MPEGSNSAWIPLIVLSALFFITTIGALYWAVKRSEFRKTNSKANVIFTQEEPEGEITDGFPTKPKKRD